MQSFGLARREDAEGAAGVWEVTLNQNLHGWFYWYTVDGVRDGAGMGCGISREAQGLVWETRGGGTESTTLFGWQPEAEKRIKNEKLKIKNLKKTAKERCGLCWP